MHEVLTERLDVRQIDHVVFDAPPCDVTLDATAAFFAAADDLGDPSEALRNWKWATLDQFRDDGHDGLVKLDWVVEVAHPGFLSFTLAHPSPACTKASGRRDGYKAPGKSDAQLRATLASRTSGSGTESASGGGLDFTPKSGNGKIVVWGKYNSTDVCKPRFYKRSIKRDSPSSQYL